MESSSSSSSKVSAVPLRCVVQHYAWGKSSDDPTNVVAKMHESQRSFFSKGMDLDVIGSGKPCAELWMGTHPNGPSEAFLDGKFLPLIDLIRQDPEWWIGKKTRDQFGDDLPFLLKVLSVEKSLSIQAHPNKKVAEKLHAEHPELYKDGNHKPEVAIPIGGCFSSMCGFRCLDEILVFAEHYPELGALVDLESAPHDEAPDKIIKHLYGKLMLAEPEIVAEELSKLIFRLREMPLHSRTREEQLVLRLNEEFPGGDVGVFSVFFLNLVDVGVGDYIFCAPDEPHAYLKGQCIECMASSDNVIRAGLTPKYKDVQTLLSILTYRDDLLEEYLINRGNPKTEQTIKPAGVDDFLVHKVGGGWQSVLEGPSILLCLPNVNLKVRVDEKAIDIAPGTVWFLRAGAKVDIAPSDTHSEKPSFLFIATC
eukprot:TRINITY_DN4203_c0_g1_i1.p1 TRINITY_DN4203_c0_g1~~TRINITY_DN4203_c0_g1_i1.p1  ORF type:complete len:423 (+),score=120.17 TRINITY_DN4203_c0_g1_i1:72-1340(+)